MLIPAYQPGAPLLALIRALSAGPVPAVVVVDNGSGAEFSPPPSNKQALCLA